MTIIMRGTAIVWVPSAPMELMLNLGSQHKKARKTLVVWFMFESASLEQWLEVTQTWILILICSLPAM